MKGKRFFIVDVFAETPHAGNQLAVMLDARDLTTEQMQVVARETNFAETSFVLDDRPVDQGWDVRIFTPRRELPFAGHPTLGTATVIREVLLDRPAEQLTLNLGIGRIPVRFAGPTDGSEPAFMKQRSPEFGARVAHGVAAAVLGVDESDLDARLPAQGVSTGVPFLIVPFKTRSAVRRAALDPRKYRELVDAHQLAAVFFFCPEPASPDNHVHARMFAPDYGVAEDPATGSAAGCLGGYLVEHDYFGDGQPIEIRVEQGYEIHRPSLLHVRGRRTDDGIAVEVGGRVFFIAKGEWLAG